MNRKTEKTVKQADPELTTSKKLDQIKSGAKIKRQTGGAEKKETIVSGKNGAKTVVHETEEKFEETAVLRKKRNYVMYESKLGTEKNTEITQIAAPKPTPKPKPKPVREPEPRVEEKIIVTKKKREYLDNYQYKETKNIKSNNPRYHVIVEHKRLGDIIGGTFDRPQIVEQTKTQTATGSAMPKLKANKSESRLVTKTKIESSLPEMTESTTTKKRTVTTTTKTESSKPEKSVTAKAEKITETTIKKRNEGTGSTTTSRTEKTTTTGGAGSSTTTKTTTRTVSENPGNEIKTQQSSTTTTTKTTTTRTTGESGGKTETKTVTKVEESSSGETGGSSIRKKYAKGRFKH